MQRRPRSTLLSRPTFLVVSVWLYLPPPKAHTAPRRARQRGRRHSGTTPQRGHRCISKRAKKEEALREGVILPAGPLVRESRRLPIFPGRLQPSIFGTTELNYCVRNGNRWVLCVIGTGHCWPSPFSRESPSSQMHPQN